MKLSDSNFILRPPLAPNFTRWFNLCKEYPKLSAFRKMQYEKFFSLRLEGKILDFGGGLKAAYLKHLNGQYEIESINIDPKIEPTYLLKPGEAFPVKEESYDCVISLNTLEHVYDPLFALQQMNRALKPGGIAYIAVPFIFRIHAHPDDYLRATPSWWVESFKRAGFDSGEIHTLVWGRSMTAASVGNGPVLLPRKWQDHLSAFFDSLHFLLRCGFAKEYRGKFTDRVTAISQGWFMEIRKNGIV